MAPRRSLLRRRRLRRRNAALQKTMKMRRSIALRRRPRRQRQSSQRKLAKRRPVMLARKKRRKKNLQSFLGSSGLDARAAASGGSSQITSLQTVCLMSGFATWTIGMPIMPPAKHRRKPSSTSFQDVVYSSSKEKKRSSWFITGNYCITLCSTYELASCSL